MGNQVGPASKVSARKPGAGRRRDPAIDDRLRQAARALYAREGWAGFHFDGVARAAGVSKDAVYRRYSDAKSLLLDALSDQSIPVLVDDRPIEEALVAYARDTFQYFTSGKGHANLRVHIDGAQYPDVLQQYRTRVVRPQIEQAVDVLERARARGEIHRDASCPAIVEALGGAVMVCALASAPEGGGDPQSPDPSAMRQLTEFVQQILHGHLTGAAARSAAAPRRRRAVADR